MRWESVWAITNLAFWRKASNSMRQGNCSALIEAFNSRIVVRNVSRTCNHRHSTARTPFSNLVGKNTEGLFELTCREINLNVVS
jgi:hypothetical protein